MRPSLYLLSAVASIVTALPGPQNGQTLSTVPVMIPTAPTLVPAPTGTPVVATPPPPKGVGTGVGGVPPPPPDSGLIGSAPPPPDGTDPGTGSVPSPKGTGSGVGSVPPPPYGTDPGAGGVPRVMCGAYNSNGGLYCTTQYGVAATAPVPYGLTMVTGPVTATLPPTTPGGTYRVTTATPVAPTQYGANGALVNGGECNHAQWYAAVGGAAIVIGQML